MKKFDARRVREARDWRGDAGGESLRKMGESVQFARRDVSDISRVHQIGFTQGIPFPSALARWGRVLAHMKGGNHMEMSVNAAF